MANPEVVVRDCDTDARAFGLPSNRICGYDDLIERSFVGLQKDARLLNAHFHLQNDECDNMVEKSRWDAGEYFAGRGKRLVVCVHFVLKARAERERPQLHAEAEVVEISSGSEEFNLRRHPTPDTRLPEGYGRPAAPGAVPLPTSDQFTNYQRRPAIFKSNKRGHLVSFKPSTEQGALNIETSRPDVYDRSASTCHYFSATEDHHPEGYERLAPARQQAHATATRRRREGYGRPASPTQDISRPYETSHPWAPPPTSRRGAPIYEFPRPRLEQRPQPAAEERIEQEWGHPGDHQVDQRNARQTSSPLFCTPPPATASEARQEQRVPAPFLSVPKTNPRENGTDSSASLINTEEDGVSSRKLKN